MFEYDGPRLFFSNGPHAARGIVEPQTGNSTDIKPVISTRVDALARQPQLTDSDRIVLKLDVEGAEISAPKSAHQVLKRDTLVIHGDRGRDRSHPTKRYVFEELGFPVFLNVPDGRNCGARGALRTGSADDQVMFKPLMENR